MINLLKKLDNNISLQKIWNTENLDESPTIKIENRELQEYFENKNNEKETNKNSHASEENLPSPPDTLPDDKIQKKQLTARDFADKVYQYIPLMTLFEDNSLLPSTIDISELKGENIQINGYVGTKNFLSLTELTVEMLESHQKNERATRDKINNANSYISSEFKNFGLKF